MSLASIWKTSLNTTTDCRDTSMTLTFDNLENEDVKISLNVLFLFISGLLLLIFGSGILLVPQAFYASDGVFLGNNPSLLSEVRASGGMLTGGALVIFAGIIRPALRSLAMMLSILSTANDWTFERPEP